MSAEAIRASIEQPSDRIILALDNMTPTQAEDVLKETEGLVGYGKANSLAQKKGWEHTIEGISSFGVKTMADTKFHDIPTTVELQVEAVAECGADLMTVHASGGRKMMQAAVEGRNRAVGNDICGLLGITVLTSLGDKECIETYGTYTSDVVGLFAENIAIAGLDGLVCSGKELKAIKDDSDLNDLVTVVPGITPEWAKKAGDQKRIVTPTEAIQSGADFIVVGRTITQPPQGMRRQEAAERIAQEVAEAL